MIFATSLTIRHRNCDKLVALLAIFDPVRSWLQSLQQQQQQLLLIPNKLEKLD
jgi:predicted nucleic acid-binding Zn ribbon protein